MASKKSNSKKNVGMSDISHELGEIFGLLKVNFEKAWKSEEKARVEKELHKGLSTLGDKLNDLKDSAKKGELDEVLMKQLHSGLKKTSQSLKKSSTKWTKSTSKPTSKKKK